MNKLNPGSTLWLVWRNGYRGFGGSCGYLASWLQMLHPGGETVITQDPNYYEYENLRALAELKPDATPERQFAGLSGPLGPRTGRMSGRTGRRPRRLYAPNLAGAKICAPPSRLPCLEREWPFRGP